MRDMSETEARLVFEDYAADLSTVPADLIEGAINDWRRTQKWFPSIAELLAVVESDWANRRRYLARLEAATVSSPEPEYVPPTEAEKAEVEALMAKLRAKWKSERAMPSAAFPQAADDPKLVPGVPERFGAEAG